MDYLIDTHTFLWFINDDERLPQNASDYIENINNNILISSASLWEIAIKISKNKLNLNKEYSELIPHQIELNKFKILPINHNHLIVNINLPFIHKDPFDRLIIAQGVSEKLPIITKDENFSKYDIKIVW